MLLVILGQSWQLVVGALFYGLWSRLGKEVDTGRPLLWHEPICHYPFNGYLVVSLAYQGFFWWSLAFLGQPGQMIFASLALLATTLNIISRQPAPSKPIHNSRSTS